ncbi:MAG: 4-hydroxy-3-methylbut-2-enyl diphosphate reductase [Microthrixaceae bacterium]|nr:4-hydroxy-3-methylbut-2-enyl diphosphate reductase [Microthrixaceae bacterium]
MKIVLANPRGFCAGVDRAIEIVERALETFGAPIYVRHEVVHNRFVVDSLRNRGAIFVDELDEVPDGATVIFSAHGVSKEVRREGDRRGLAVFDATCPLVTKVHIEVARHGKAGRDVVLIGHAGHPEVEGTMGQWDPKYAGRIHLVETPECVAGLKPANSDKLAYVSQTTLSVDDTRAVIEALRQHFPNVLGPRHDDICYATQNRQVAIKKIAPDADLVIVVGSANSSNSVRLVEVALEYGARAAYRVDYAHEVKQEWLDGVRTIGVTSGASVPEVLVQELLEDLAAAGFGDVVPVKTAEEDLQFSLPKELRKDASGRTDARAIGGRISHE